MNSKTSTVNSLSLCFHTTRDFRTESANLPFHFHTEQEVGALTHLKMSLCRRAPIHGGAGGSVPLYGEVE